MIKKRSFSLYKRNKNFLRIIPGQEKLAYLAILAIESEITNQIDVDTIIDEFARSKSRRKVFQFTNNLYTYVCFFLCQVLKNKIF